MPTTITFRRGTAAPTSGSGLTLGEPAFDSSLKRLYIGQGTGVTAVWVGAQISGLSSDIAAGLTYQIPTMGAVKDYVASTTSGVASLNGLVGGLTLTAGTNIGITASGTTITITNQGVQSFNGLTGAVGGVCAAAGNTFTVLQTFTNGITTSYLYASTGSTFGSTLQVNGGATFAGTTDHTGVARFAAGVTVSGRLDVGGILDVVGGATFESRMDVSGAAKFNGNVNIGDASSDVLTVTAGTTFASRIDSNNGIYFTGAGSGTIQTVSSTLVLNGTTTAAYGNGTGPSVIYMSPAGLTLSSGSGRIDIYPSSAPTGQASIRLWSYDSDAPLPTYSTTITPTYPSANRTITLPDANGVVALDSTSVASVAGITGAVLVSAGTGIGVVTASKTITFTNLGVQSFNGLTGNVGGVCAAQTNTFTAVQTFNSGVTFGSTVDATGAARFNGGATASTLDVSGAARLASTLAVTGVLTQTGGATFGSTTDHTGAARFASTVTATGAVTANGGITASTLDVSGAARTTGDMTVGATLTVNGNFFVAGTVTTVNRTDLNIDDKIITMGRTLASDTLADGGGLVLKGTSDRTWTWSQNGYWQSSQGVNVATGSGYSVNGTSVLSSSTLGSGVTTSSLQAVGIVSSGTWQATAVGATYGGTGRTSYTIGDILFANGTSSLTVLGASTAGRLLAANGAGTAPEYKQLIINDGSGTSIATITSGTGTLTAAIQNATTAVRGVASFDPEMFTVTSGNASIARVDGGTF